MRKNSAQYYKRLGEAAHGIQEMMQEGQTGWVFLKLDEPDQVRYATTEAERAAIEDELNHGSSSSGWVEAEFTADFVARPPDRNYLVVVEPSIGVTHRYSAGVHSESNSNPHVDAVFFTNSAIEKFLMPYTTSLYGAEVAGTLLKRFHDSPAEIMIHDPGTVSTGVEMDHSLADRSLVASFSGLLASAIG